MRLAIIPARGGSKRIPRKNIKDFCGKPMIAWSILSAIESGCFDQVVVSTDDPEIADVAMKYGASVPFLRPSTLADDYAGTIPVIQHAIRECQLSSLHDQVCCIYATAAFVSPFYLREGLNLLLDSNANFVMSVGRYSSPIQRAVKIGAAGKIQMIDPSSYQSRSQDLEEAFHDAGQFYWGTARAWLEGLPVFADHTVPVVLPAHLVQDIDTPEDWVRAEIMFQAIQSLAFAE
ncbi:pseudaminic acid cytidylyltransferase [Pseudomonas sp. F3-2]|uniref:pseudaminic acid cytidylyltransferase n=1 Tax=Pseudomonas sp. F3-2 TaxID=3141539 RepID=UPI00315D87C9